MQIEIETYEEEAFASNTNEEPLNALTHGFGWVLSLFGSALLLHVGWHGGPSNLIALGIYSSSLIGVYAFSTLSHAIQDPEWKLRLRVWDQGMIYLLIAGTYTPFLWLYSHDLLRMVCLILVWAAAMGGFCSKVVHRHRVDNLSTQSYILLGWIPAVLLYTAIPFGCLAWIVAGGVCYTLGTVFLKSDQQYRYFHATWHILVILGSACHFFAIYQFQLARQSIV